MTSGPALFKINARKVFQTTDFTKTHAVDLLKGMLVETKQKSIYKKNVRCCIKETSKLNFANENWDYTYYFQEIFPGLLRTFPTINEVIRVTKSSKMLIYSKSLRHSYNSTLQINVWIKTRNIPLPQTCELFRVFLLCNENLWIFTSII